MKRIITFFGILIVGAQSIAMADTCPPPPTSVDPSITTTTSFDKKSGVYTFKYALQNAQDSQIPIDEFILQMPEKPPSTLSPTHWLADFTNLSYMPFNLSWQAVPSSKFKSVAIVPGQSLSGFGIQSPLPPGLIQFNVSGLTGVPASSPPADGAADDEPQPNCPNWDFNNPRFKRLVTGLTTGPENPNTISVAIRLRDEPGTHVCDPINSNTPSGKVAVLVLGSKTFDPTQAVLTSFKFGPNAVAPLSAKLVPAGFENIAKWEEHEEWERIILTFIADHERNEKKQNILLVFDETALGIQCVLDKALFLTGTTLAGQNIVGGASTRAVGCDVRKPGVRPRKQSKDAFFSAFKKIRKTQRAKPLNNP